MSAKVIKDWIVSNKRTAATFAMILLGVLVVNLYRTTMVGIEEEMVDAYYQKHINATRTFDYNTLCNLMDRKYRSVDTVVTEEGTETVPSDKRGACEATRDSMRVMWELINETKAEPEIKYTIVSVDLSEDRRRADVKLRGSIKIGKALDMQFTATEILIRRYGQIRSVGGTSRTVVKTAKR